MCGSFRGRMKLLGREKQMEGVFGEVEGCEDERKDMQEEKRTDGSEEGC